MQRSIRPLTPLYAQILKNAPTPHRVVRLLQEQKHGNEMLSFDESFSRCSLYSYETVKLQPSTTEYTGRYREGSSFRENKLNNCYFGSPVCFSKRLILQGGHLRNLIWTSTLCFVGLPWRGAPKRDSMELVPWVHVRKAETRTRKRWDNQEVTDLSCLSDYFSFFWSVSLLAGAYFVPSLFFFSASVFNQCTFGPSTIAVISVVVVFRCFLAQR